MQGRGEAWTSYVFAGRYIDIRLHEGVWIAYEFCEDGGAGFELERAESEDAAFDAVAKHFFPKAA